MASKVNPHISVDFVIFCYDEEGLKVFLMERTYSATHILGVGIGKRITDWKLPGDLVRDDEDLDISAKRILKELTGFENVFIEKFSAFGDLNRFEKKNDKEWLKSKRSEPNARVITITYLALVKPGNAFIKPGALKHKWQWCSLKEVPELAFDHNEITEKALLKLRSQLNESAIAFELLPEEFTLVQAQGLYEAISGITVDKRNFRRKMKNLDLLIPLNKKEKGVLRKPGHLYKLNVKPQVDLSDLF